MERQQERGNERKSEDMVRGGNRDNRRDKDNDKREREGQRHMQTEKKAIGDRRSEREGGIKRWGEIGGREEEGEG